MLTAVRSGLTNFLFQQTNKLFQPNLLTSKQCDPTTGPRAAYGPLQRFQWLSRKHSENILKSEIC